MTWQQTWRMSVLSTVLAAAACLVFNEIYNQAFATNFSTIAGTTNIVASVLIGCTLMAIGYKLTITKGVKWLGWVNVVYGLLSFISIIGVLAFSLPLETESPELFPGLMIPMHFFPLLSFLIVQPFFKLSK